MAALSPADLKRASLYALRHYVSFSYYARSQEILSQTGMAQACVCSAFVMRVRGIWCLVTAGHVLDAIDAERAAGMELVSFRLWDGWSINAPHRQHVPFDFLESPSIRLNQGGLDYGLIRLRPLIADNLAANDIVPIGEENYEKDWPDEFHGYAMLGTPGTSVRLDRTGERSTALTQSTWIIPLEREESPPAELVQDHPRLYARIAVADDSPEWKAIGEDIKGMSGGPVLGIRRDSDGLQYWVVAIQSGWLPSRRIIAASYFQDFARYVGEQLDGVA